MRYGPVCMAMLVAVLATEAKAYDLTDDLSITGYVDARLLAPTDQKSWLQGGQGKFRYGSGQNFGGEAVLQASWHINDELSAISVLRAEPQTRQPERNVGMPWHLGQTWMRSSSTGERTPMSAQAASTSSWTPRTIRIEGKSMLGVKLSGNRISSARPPSLAPTFNRRGESRWVYRISTPA